ncbi:MAG TPA: hypothetical protein VIB48_08145 [Acidimicrobiia bacterium]|jgi:hypothetical protein
MRRLARSGFRRGLLGGSRTWLILGITATGLRVMTRLLAQKPEVVYSAKLQPGEVLRITALPPESR